MKSINDTSSHISNQLLLNTIKQRNWNEARNIAYNDAAFAKIKDNAGFLPLHLAIKLGCTTELVVVLLKAFPGSVSVRDPDGNFPLHLASYHNKGRLWINISEITTILFAAYPEAISLCDKNNDLAIHIALRHRAPDELINFLFVEYPESAALKDHFGNYPLHLAIQFQASYAVVSTIMNLHPAALRLGNANGSLPLHKVAQFDSPLDILLMILEAEPSAIETKDSRGNLPLHLCFLFCAGPPSEERLRYYLQRYPAAIGVANNEGSTPFMMMHRPQDHYVEDYR
jgi:ankyrin repeat protein